MRDKASSALSIPVALRAFRGVLLGGSSSSRLSRLSFREGAAEVFLGAVFVFLGLEGALRSSSARRASFSAFLRAASAFLASASSLGIGSACWLV